MKKYWTEKEENAIKKYISSDYKSRDRFYQRNLYKPMTELVKGVILAHQVFGYNKTGYSVDELILHLVTELWQVLERTRTEGKGYDPDKGRAFSFFSVVCRNKIFNLNDQYSKRNDPIKRDVDWTEDEAVQHEIDQRSYEAWQNDQSDDKEKQMKFTRQFREYIHSNITDIFKLRDDQEIVKTIMRIEKDHYHQLNESHVNIKPLVKKLSDLDDDLIEERYGKVKYRLNDIFKELLRVYKDRDVIQMDEQIGIYSIIK